MLPEMPGLDPDRLRFALGGSAGAVVYGLYYLIQRFKAGQSLTLSDLWSAFVNVAAATLTGVISAVAIGPMLVAAIPWEGLRNAADPVSVGFIVGAFAWEALPWLMEGGRKFLKAKANKLGGEP